MKYAPRPENDFASFIRTYYDECRARFDGIEAIAGKWMFRDLVPGLSDFDTRFLCRDDMTADDWCAMSQAVGEAHRFLCAKYSSWARNLEHLPGINLTWVELGDEASYYPEYQQWTFYHATQTKKLAKAQAALRNRAWDVKDEYFHLKKFCLYFGRYDRTIDPGCNLFPHEVKYALHSRIMHYFLPPLQSALCVLERRHIAGKFEALEIGQRRFPKLPCWNAIDEILHAHYEAADWMREPKLNTFEDDLENALQQITAPLREASTLLSPEAGLDIAKWKKELNGVPVDPALLIFDNAKFARLMKGRLLFYANPPAHFDATWLLENELRRIGQNFFQAPFSIYWKLKTGEDIADPSDIVERLEVLTAAEQAATYEFASLTNGTRAHDRTLASDIAVIFDDFYRALHKISFEARRLSNQ